MAEATRMEEEVTVANEAGPFIMRFRASCFAVSGVVTGY